MGVEAVSLAMMSFLHLNGDIAGGRRPFDPGTAGIAEAVIGLALAVGAVAVWRAPASQARQVGLAAVGFAIVGFLVGLNFTLRAGDILDVTYHATVLPVLVITLVLLLRWRDRRRIQSDAT